MESFDRQQEHSQIVQSDVSVVLASEDFPKLEQLWTLFVDGLGSCGVSNCVATNLTAQIENR